MGFLDNIERGIERAVNSVFARTLKSGLQPVELLAALKRQVDGNTQIFSRDRIIAPNRFTVRLASKDYERFQSMGTTLHTEIAKELKTYIKKQGYQTVGPVTLSISQDTDLKEGLPDISSENVGKDSSNWQPIVTIAGRKHRLRRGKTVVGRGSEADITISDNGASRKHLTISWDGHQLSADDLGSTNGSKLNGQRFQQARLDEDSIIQIGHTQLIIGFEPEEMETLPFRPSRPGMEPK